MNKVDEEFFVKQVCRHLDASIAHLTLSIEQSLTQARQAALLQNAHLAQAVSSKLNEEIGLVGTAEDIELYDNLEFYLWLAENESLIL
tara:strand:- start:125 stop:388 length:264 start_codon:yes stop_codon:yes gene_type:complete